MIGENEMDGMAGNKDGGFCIEICVKPDGKITVESGPLDVDDMGGEETGTPVESIDAALAKVRELYTQGGGAEGDANFDAGYGKPPESPMMVREKAGM